LDGELIAGDPCAPDAYRKTVSMVMADDKPVDRLRYWVFDYFIDHGTRDAQNFAARYRTLCGNLTLTSETIIVPHTYIHTAATLTKFEEEHIEAGHEGVMLRSPDGPYKCGRSTTKEGYLLKLKRFADSEAEVIGVVELMHNGNEAKKNALGRTERSTAKAGKTGMGVMGALQVRDVKTGVEFEIGTGFDATARQDIWMRAEITKDRKQPFKTWPLVKYKYFAGGSKDKPRFPVFLGWRDKRDV
jgi:DNA ligase-1